MKLPHTVTIYNRTVEIDKDTFSETIKHYITVIDGVLLIANKAANVRESGLEGADAVTLHIPANCVAVDGLTGNTKQFVQPIEFQNAADKSVLWTLSNNDGNTFFVKGTVIEEGKDEQTINAMYDDCYRMTSVDFKDFGSETMQHWECGGA